MIFIRLLILFFIFISQSAKAVETMGIEVKEYDNVDAYIIYHPDYYRIDVTYVAGVVKIKSEYPIKFRKLTPVSINTLTSNLKNENSKTISFKTKEKYHSFEVVRGEKLTAIKFRTEKHFDKVTHEIQALNKQDHSAQGMKVEEKKQGQKEEVKIKKTKDLIEVKFEFEEVVTASAFDRYNKVWIAFDKKKGFEFPSSGDLKPPTLIDIPDYTVLSFEIPAEYKPSFTSNDDKTWVLSFRKNDTQLRALYKIEKLLDHYGAHISGDAFKKIINFTDPAVGDKITMVTTSKSLSGVDIPHFFSGFTIHKTLAGSAITWIEENYKVEFSKTGIEAYTLNNAILKEAKNQEPHEETVDYSKTALPFAYNAAGRDFNNKKAILLANIVKSKPEEYDAKTYELASFFFKEKMYQEALGALTNIKFDEDFLQNYPQAPLFKAALLSIVGRYQDSESILKLYLTTKISTALKAEAKIWTSYNKVKIEDSSTSIGILAYIDGFFDNYSDDIYWKLLSCEFELASNNNDLDLVEQLFRKIRAPKEKAHIDELNFYKATFYRKNKKFNLANNYYDSIKLDYTNAFQYVRSELDQVDMLIKMSQIEPDEAVKKLDKLKYLWRGDKLEYQTLIKSAELRQGSQDYIRALRTYKYLLEAFPNNKGSVHISHQMAEIYNNFVFSKGGVVDKMSDFEIVSLYYEFRELTPLGEAGDKVVLTVAKRMINLDLLDEAERILNHQVQYRLSGKDKIVSGDHLAAIYIINKKPKLAIEVLNDTDLVNYGFLEHMTRLRVKSKAYLDIGDYASALEVLKDDDSQDAKILKLEAYFKMSDWENYILTSESDIVPIISVGKQMPAYLEKETLRLAISYSMLGKADEVKYLASNIKTEDNMLVDAINLIASSNEKVDIRNLDNKFNVDEVDKLFKSIVNKMFDFE